MNNSKKNIQIADAEYQRYLANIKEIEEIIAAAQKSCEEIEKLRHSITLFFYKTQHIEMHLISKLVKAVFGIGRF